MRDEHQDKPLALGANSKDIGLAVAKGTLGVIPYIGPFAAEILTVSIPNQRLDRVTKFLTDVEARVAKLENEKLGTIARTPEFIDLYEDGCRAATVSKTNERIEILAKLTADSVTIEGRSILEQSRYMRVLNQLDDQEILLLRYLSTGNKNLMPSKSVDPRQRMLDQALDAAAHANLFRLGLIEQEEKIVRTRNRSLAGPPSPPVLSKGRHRPTSFAYAFLDHIGLGQLPAANLEPYI